MSARCAAARCSVPSSKTLNGHTRTQSCFPSQRLRSTTGATRPDTSVQLSLLAIGFASVCATVYVRSDRLPGSALMRSIQCAVSRSVFRRALARERFLPRDSSAAHWSRAIAADCVEMRVISSTENRNAASFAFDGFVKPLTLRTNCSAAARISSSVDGGSKLKSVLMFLHMGCLPFKSGVFEFGDGVRDVLPRRGLRSDRAEVASRRCTVGRGNPDNTATRDSAYWGHGTQWYSRRIAAS